MKFRRSLALVLTAMLSAAIVPVRGEAAGRAGPAPGSALYNLQQQQLQELKNLAQQYQELRRVAGTNQGLLDELRYQYLSDAWRIKQSYKSQDTRGQMIDDAILKNAKLDAKGNPILDEKGKIVSDIENTGSAPKDVRSDVDLNAKTPKAADNAINDWQANGHELVGPNGEPLTSIDWNDPPYKVVDRTTDTTLWLPCDTPACRAAKVRDPDAWTTEGGLEGTGNSGKVRDPYGYYLDNEKKFAHAQEALEDLMNGGTPEMTFEDALKTAAKSLYKAAERAGNDNSELLKQADALRNYSDPIEAGIADPGDSPAVVAQKVRQWLQNAESEMLQLKGILKAAGEALTAQRFAEADKLLNNSADPEAFQKALEAKKILDQQGRVDASNEPAERVNIDLGGVGTKAPPRKPSLPERFGATSSSPKCFGNAVARAGLGAGLGAAIGAAVTYTACLATTLPHGGSEKACRDAALSKENIGQAAFWGAVAALGPWGEIAAAGYGGYQGADQAGTLMGEMLNTLSAVQKEEAVRITRELFQPVDDAIGSCDFGKALLISQRLQEQNPTVKGLGFTIVRPNYTPLINRLTSQRDAEKKVKQLVKDANAATDPAQHEQLLNDALKVGRAGNIPMACLQQWVPASCPVQAANSGASSNPPAVCTNPTWICSYKDASTGKTVNSLAPATNVANCPTACIASNGAIASYMWNGLAGSGSSSPSSFNGRPVVQANSTAGAPGTQGGCPNGQRNGNFYNVGGGGTYGCMCASGDWVAYGRSCSDNSSSAHTAAVGVDAPIVAPPTYTPAASPPPSAAVSAPPPSAALLPLASTPIPPLNAPNAGMPAIGSSATNSGFSSGGPTTVRPNPCVPAANGGTSRPPVSMTNSGASTSSGIRLQPNNISSATNSGSSSGGPTTAKANPCNPGKSASTSSTGNPASQSNTKAASPQSGRHGNTGRSQTTTSRSSTRQHASLNRSQTTSRSSSNGRSVGGRSASSARSQTSFRQAQARPMAQNFRSSGFGSRGFGGFGGRRFSDMRLKEEIVPLGRLDNGIGVYRFRYRGNDHARYVGVMAQEVQTIVPDAVSRGRDGYLRVDYDRLGLTFLTWDEWSVRRGTQSRLRTY